MKVSFFGEKFVVGVEYENADKVIDITEEKAKLLNMGYTINREGEISKTEKYDKYIQEQVKEEKQKKVDGEVKQYEAISVILEIIKGIYVALPQTTKDKIDTGSVKKYTDLKEKIDQIIL